MRNLVANVNIKCNNKLLTEKQLNILKLISKTKSQNKTAEILKIPPSSVNIQIKRLEKKIGVKLTYSSTSGTILTEDAKNIIGYYDSMTKRILNKSFITCGYICGELGKILFEDILISSFNNILELYNMNLTNIIGIDDPYWSFRLGEPIPVVYDHIVVAYKKERNLKNLVGIRYSPQRIVWNILKNDGVNFKITKTVKNPFYAIDLIEEGYTLFLNESLVRYLKKNYVVEKPYFYEKTRHTLNFIVSNEEDEQYIENMIRKKRREINNRGFEIVECFD